ncbi:hypothetical protein [Acinetobacter nectaris]|uniref:hypothetical protein n=1 Tax=Acinetobacter nectaris TaxID=1219382 RepID=UPI001F4285DF|nr:hypothetical protein [Acinetobacter nectaris]MCF8999675.1 hypothetical protein [Acinetobacter nectaris]MCF9028290.1 hypothetical protein [Acinetobacter nectaris]
MKHITKAMSHLAKVSRGLDRSHPEFKQQPVDSLAKPLQKATKQVYKLEKEHGALITDVAISRSMLIDVVQMIQTNYPQDTVINSLVEVINCLGGEEINND